MKKTGFDPKKCPAERGGCAATDPSDSILIPFSVEEIRGFSRAVRKKNTIVRIMNDVNGV